MDIRLKVLTGAVRNRIKFRAPFILSHLITERCNCTCPFCYWKKGHISQEADLAAINKFYEKIKSMGVTINYIWGGEPFIREDIKEILELSRMSGFITIVNTNGSMAYDYRETICETCHYILLSIDAIGNKHDEIRGAAGLFNKVVSLIDYFKGKNKNVYINTLLSKLNFMDVREILKFYESTGVKGFFNFMETGFPGQDDYSKEVSSLGLDKEELKETAGILLDCKKQNDVILNSRSYYRKFIKNEKFKCHYQDIVLQVRANGDIENCAKRNRPFGNIKTDDLSDIFSSDEFRTSRLSTRGCNNCMVGDVIDTSYLYSLKPEVVWNFFKNVKI